MLFSIFQQGHNKILTDDLENVKRALMLWVFLNS